MATYTQEIISKGLALLSDGYTFGKKQGEAYRQFITFALANGCGDSTAVSAMATELLTSQALWPVKDNAKQGLNNALIAAKTEYAAACALPIVTKKTQKTDGRDAKILHAQKVLDLVSSLNAFRGWFGKYASPEAAIKDEKKKVGTKGKGTGESGTQGKPDASNTGSGDTLTTEQKDTIAAKVKELGTAGAVAEFYTADAEVDKFARRLASEMFMAPAPAPEKAAAFVINNDSIAAVLSFLATKANGKQEVLDLIDELAAFAGVKVQVASAPLKTWRKTYNIRARQQNNEITLTEIETE